MYVTAAIQFSLQTWYFFQHEPQAAWNSGVKLPMEKST